MGVQYINGEMVVFIPDKKNDEDVCRDERLNLDVLDQHIAACSVCRANNFDNDFHTMGKRVDRLYELQVGGMAMTLCDKCLDRIAEMIVNRPTKEV